MRPGRRWIAAVLLAAASGQAAADTVEDRRLGRQLIARLGCAGCHALDGPGMEVLGPSGPDLRRIAAKLRPTWARDFIQAPRSHDPTAAMPHLLEPGDDADAGAIVAYLWRHSERPAYPPPPAGDPARGRALFASVGCTGCHLRDATAVRDLAAPERLRGPNLAHLPAKVDAAWLFAWLRDPRAYAPETAMPDLRLGADEAADLAAFLLEDRPAQAAVAGAPSDDPGTVASGRDAIELYGCAGCHRIAGFEDAERPAGAWTTLEGFTGHGMAGLPDFALSGADLEALRAAVAPAPEPPELARGRWLVAWSGCRGCHRIEGAGQALRATVDDPGMLPPDLRHEGARVQASWLADYLADPGQVLLRAWLDARMPDFGLDRREIATLVAYFAALEPADLAERPPGPPRPQSIALGREAYEQMPCGRCHPTTTEVARRRASGQPIDAASLAPPLDLAATRLRWGWLGPWLEDPQAWSPGTKMPTFFTAGPNGGHHSPFEGALDAPVFAEARQRMLAHVTSVEVLAAFLADADAVIAALRDYVWSLGESPGSGTPEPEP